MTTSSTPSNASAPEASSDARPFRGHRAVVTDAGRPLPGPVPTSGPVAILPSESPLHRDAVRSAGVEVAPLSSATTGLVWLDPRDPAGLEAALAASASVTWVQLPFAGVDAFAHLIAAYGDRVLFTSAKGAYAEPVAEHALALTLATLRVLPKRARARSWTREPEGVSLYGRNVLVIGAGGIALEYIRLLTPFDVHVTVVRRSPEPVPTADRTVRPDQLDSVLPDADVVMIAAAMTDDTAQMFGAPQFRLMKPQARLVNIARGGLVDTAALVEALETGEIAGAGLDVTDPEPLPDGHPLWDAPNVIITPHQADTPDMVAPLLAERIRINAAAVRAGDGTGFVGVVDPVAGY